MNIQFTKNKKKVTIKKRFNPHAYWIFFIGVCIFVFSLELFYFSWFFIETNKFLDAPVSPTLETNSVKIKSLNRKLDVIETAVSARKGVLGQ